jgi:hypothetical protein
MLTAQQPNRSPDPTVPSLPGAHMNRWLAIVLAIVALGGVFAGILIYQAHQGPEALVSSACPGALTQAQEAAIRQNLVQIDDTILIPRNIPISGDVALQTSKASPGASGASARCLVEALVAVSASDPNLLAIPAFHEVPFSGPAWMVILRGLGQESASAGASAGGAYSDATDDLVAFVDAYSGILVGSISIPQATEQ